MKKIRYGITGFGNFAERTIAPAIRASANSDVVAVQKRSLKAAREKADALKIAHAFDSVQSLVSHPDVDAVFIVSANSEHCGETLAAARAGKHVLVEKPMAMNVAEAEQMIRVCEENRVKLMVGHMVRLSPAVRRAKDLVHSGAIGKVTYVKTEFIYDGRLSRRPWLLDPKVAGGGPVFDVGVHCLDTIRFIVDDDVVSVKSHTEPIPNSTTTETTGIISLRFSTGVLASIHCSYASPIRRSTIEILGTDGLISVPNFTRSSMTIPLRISHGNGDEESEKTIEEIDVPDLYIGEVTLFSDCILNNAEPPIPGVVGLINQRILEESLSSA